MNNVFIPPIYGCMFMAHVGGGLEIVIPEGREQEIALAIQQALQFHLQSIAEKRAAAQANKEAAHASLPSASQFTGPALIV